MLRSFTLSTLLPLLPRAWQRPVLLATALFMSSCGSAPKIKGVPSNLPDIPLYGSASTPPHSMLKGDYPFDSSGNYVTAWAAQGGNRGSGGGSYTSGHSEDMPPEPAPSSRRGPASRVQNAPPEIVSSYSASGGRSTNEEESTRKGGAPEPSVTTTKKSNSAPVKKSVASTSGSSTPKKKVGSASGSSTLKKKVGSASSSSTPKKKSSSGTGKHVVKSSDTLASIAKKYGTTEKKLKAANGLKSDLIRDGRALVIPK